MGRRVKKEVYECNTAGTWPLNPDVGKLFVYDGWNLVLTLNGAGDVQKSNVWGLDLSQSMQGAGGVGGLVAEVDSSGSAEESYSFCYDGNGNVGQLINTSGGTIAARYEYDPYGKIVDFGGDYAGENVFRFSTKFHDDDTNLVYYGYRYFSAELGRWISKDPLEERGGWNLCSFIINDPINLFDLLGLLKGDPPIGPTGPVRVPGTKLPPDIPVEIPKPKPEPVPEPSPNLDDFFGIPSNIWQLLVGLLFIPGDARQAETVEEMVEKYEMLGSPFFEIKERDDIKSHVNLDTGAVYAFISENKSKRAELEGLVLNKKMLITVLNPHCRKVNCHVRI